MAGFHTRLGSSVTQVETVPTTQSDLASANSPPDVVGRGVPFPTLVEQHQAEIRRFVLRKVREPAIADDLCQETFLRGFRAYSRLTDPEANVRAWLFKIAANVCVDHFRRLGRESALRTEPLPDDLPTTDGEVDG